MIYLINLILLFLIISQSIHSQGRSAQLGTQLIYLGLSTNDAQGRNRGYNRDMRGTQP
jgi:hypothetical protein